MPETVRSETAKSETPEAKPIPEAVVGAAVTVVENRYETSTWENVEEIAAFLKKGGRAAKTTIGVSLALVPKIVFGLLKFAKKLISGEGKMSFKEGYEMGQEALSFEGKKEK